MSTPSYSLVNNATGEKIDLPAISGTLGPAGLQLADASTSTGDASAGIMQLWFGEGGAQRIVDLDVKRYQGCYFVEF